MATVTTNKSARKASKHPAIVALHAAHKELRTWNRGDVGPCFDSDLRHDDRAIAANPDQPFVWLISRHGTHMCRLGSADDCYVDVTRPWPRSTIAMFLNSVCVECYAPEAIPEGWLRLYLWNGATLARYASLAAIKRAVSEAMCARAISRLESRIVLAREDLAALRSYESRTDRAEQALQSLTDEVESIRLSDWGLS